MGGGAAAVSGRYEGIAWPALGAVNMAVDTQTTDEAQAEMAEHGCLALRLFRFVGSAGSNLLTSPEPGAEVLVRASGGGWVRSVVDRDGAGWFVRVGDRRLGVVLSAGRGCCVVSEGA